MKRKQIVIGVVVIGLILIGSVLALNFAGGQRLTGSVRAAPAAELPAARADLLGVFTQRQDKSVIVATTIQEYSKEEFPDGTKKLTHIFSGPYTEIVTTKDTIIYEDVTNSYPSPHTQQYVEESTLDGLGPEALVTAWGRRQGDRLLADVLVFYNP
jgi:hypothetical protein